MPAAAIPASPLVAIFLSGLGVAGRRPSSVPASNELVLRLESPALLDHPDSPQLDESSDEPFALGEGGTPEIIGMSEDNGCGAAPIGSADDRSSIVRSVSTSSTKTIV